MIGVTTYESSVDGFCLGFETTFYNPVDPSSPITRKHSKTSIDVRPTTVITNYDLRSTHLIDVRMSYDQVDNDTAIAFKMIANDGTIVPCGNFDTLSEFPDVYTDVGNCEPIPIHFRTDFVDDRFNPYLRFLRVFKTSLEIFSASQ